MHTLVIVTYAYSLSRPVYNIETLDLNYNKRMFITNGDDEIRYSVYIQFAVMCVDIAFCTRLVPIVCSDFLAHAFSHAITENKFQNK